MAQFPTIQQPVYPFTTKIKDPSLQPVQLVMAPEP